MKLPTTWELPNQIKQRFGQKGAGKQRAMFAEDHLLLVLHKAPAEDARDRETVFFWRNPAGEWDMSGRGRGIRCLQDHIDEYAQIEQRLTKEYDKAVDSEDYFEILECLTPVLRAAKNLHDTMQSAREAVKSDREIIDLRDTCGEIQRTLELLCEDSKNALDYSIARKGEEQARFSQQAARAGHRLNILAAIFFPLTALSSLFGMNISSGLEQAPQSAFWTVLMIGIMLGIFMCMWVLKAAPSED